MSTSRPNREQGQAGLLVVCNLTLAFATIGLAVDVGWGYYTRQKAQAAADAAASAAAAWASANGVPSCGQGGVTCNSDTSCSYPNVTPPTTSFQVGCAYAEQNGFVNSGTQTVAMSANTTAPPGVSGNTPAYWVKATVSDNPFTLFGSFGGMNQFRINASAIAAVTYLSAGACIYVLDSTAGSAMSVGGSVTVTTSCGIYVNSSSGSAFSTGGNATITASQILVNGGVSVGSNTAITPTPTTNAGSVADPFAGVAMPTFSNTCNFTNFKITGGGSYTLNPGTYCGGITIQSQSTVTLNPGLYILNGGGFNVSSSSVTTGTGVTLFNTGQYGYSVAPVSVGGSAVLNLTAPSSGTYQGMLFIQDRNLSYSSSNNFTGSTSSVLTGSLYFPTTNVTYAGTSATGSYTAVVAKRMSFTGNANFKNDPTGVYTGLATTVRGLIQ